MARSARRVGKCGLEPGAVAFSRATACGTFIAMKPESATFDVPDEAHDARRLAEALADVAAGRVISHKAMKAWLLSWGTPDELPPPQVGD